MNFLSNEDQTLKTLGLAWNTLDDRIYYTTYSFKNAERITKRVILSEIVKIFDPIGLLGPIILQRGLMQDVWRSGIQWDESVPQNIYSEWLEFARQWELIDQIPFDRKLLAENCREIQFHGFCDASNIGYGACLYVRSCGEDDNVTIRLLCAKSRVAPLKTTTIPQLELCGAKLLAQLYQEVTDTLEIIPNRTIFWCDSTIVLH